MQSHYSETLNGFTHIIPSNLFHGLQKLHELPWLRLWSHYLPLVPVFASRTGFLAVLAQTMYVVPSWAFACTTAGD